MPERLTPANNEAANFIAHAPTTSNDEQTINELEAVSATNEVTASGHERDQELAHLQQLLTSDTSVSQVIDSPGNRPAPASVWSGARRSCPDAAVPLFHPGVLGSM